MFTTIIVFIVILSLLVFVHELGHFWTARKFGVKADEFGFGFPPRAFGVYKDENGNWKKVYGNKKVEDAPSTIFSINWLPLGGFVKIKGEDGEERAEPDSFSYQKIWKRIVIISAGVTMNVVLAAVLIGFGFMIGLPQVLEDLPAGARIKDENIQVVQVLEGSPAAGAGLQMGDIILSVNGRQFATYEELSSFMSAEVGNELNYKIKRGKEIMELNITPVLLTDIESFEADPFAGKIGATETYEDVPEEAGIGVAVAEMGIVSFVWYQALWEGITTTFYLIWFIIVAFAMVIKDLIIGQGSGVEVAGPVGIAVMTGQVTRLGFIYIMQFAAILSINLAIINFLPFPALDGGRVVFLLVEKIRGKAVPEKVETAMHNIGFALLMVLVVLVTFRDVIKLF